MYHTDNLQTLIGSGVLYVVIMSRTRVRVNIHSILPECQGTPCSKQA